MQCEECGSTFPDPVWPATRGKFCSRKCRIRAYYMKNRTRILARQAAARVEDPERVRATKRKYNTSDKGRDAQERYRQTHDITAVYLDKYRTDVTTRIIQRSREISRKKLLKTRIRKCEKCGVVGNGRQVQCHHKDGNPLNRVIDNLQWLCLTCHNSEHVEWNLLE